MCLKYCMWNRECQKYGVLSNRQLIKFYLWYEDFQPYNEGFPFFFSFFNPGQFMPDEVTERAGEWVHRFHFHRFNGSVRMSGEATPDPRSHLDSPPGPLTSLVPFLASITGTVTTLFSCFLFPTPWHSARRQFGSEYRLAFHIHN